MGNIYIGILNANENILTSPKSKIPICLLPFNVSIDIVLPTFVDELLLLQKNLLEIEINKKKLRFEILNLTQIVLVPLDCVFSLWFIQDYSLVSAFFVEKQICVCFYCSKADLGCGLEQKPVRETFFELYSVNLKNFLS
jgi:hypothetical protein